MYIRYWSPRLHAVWKACCAKFKGHSKANVRKMAVLQQHPAAHPHRAEVTAGRPDVDPLPSAEASQHCHAHPHRPIVTSRQHSVRPPQCAGYRSSQGMSIFNPPIAIFPVSVSLPKVPIYTPKDRICAPRPGVCPFFPSAYTLSGPIYIFTHPISTPDL